MSIETPRPPTRVRSLVDAGEPSGIMLTNEGGSSSKPAATTRSLKKTGRPDKGQLSRVMLKEDGVLSEGS